MAELDGDEAAIRGVVCDYVDGWFDGDAARMERALHPELVKHRHGTEGDNPGPLVTVTATEMIDSTRKARVGETTPPTAGLRSRSHISAETSPASRAGVTATSICCSRSACPKAGGS